MENRECRDNRICHIVNMDEKFTEGYINFMEKKLPEYVHVFFTLKPKTILDTYENTMIIYIQSYFDLVTNCKYQRIIRSTDKIIVSGVFGVERALALLGRQILKKTYFHFWGGDFYRYSNIISIKRRFAKIILQICLKNCAGIINLVPNDYDELCKVFSVNVKKFVAPMPHNPKKVIDYSKYRGTNSLDKIRILVGNSATPENQHLHVFNLLSKYRNIEIICPLSYGDSKYRETILKRGHELFGERFKPLLNFLSRNDYIKMLSECNVGIFNTNRQQGMGNISTMFNLGKKVYIRSDTSMWKYYINDGFTIYDILTIKNQTLDDLLMQTEEEIERNYNAVNKSSGFERAIKRWRIVLND